MAGRLHEKALPWYSIKTKTMKKFIVLYHAPAEAVASMGDATPEEMEAGMKPWMEWAARCGDKLVDMGTPLANGIKLIPDGSSKPSEVGVQGFSILQAENIDDAKALMDGHPHLGWHAGCEIEIHESMSLPGM